MPASLDQLLTVADQSLRTVWARHHANRASPAQAHPVSEPLPEQDRHLSGALMRVNHVGEVCAQALYQAQALTTRDPALQQHFAAAAREETDHLAWTEQRLAELGSRPSLLNPLWYAGAFMIGVAAGRLGDRASLGFVIETERQVEQHLDGHLQRLPQADTASRAVVAQMRDDEARHAREAERAGGIRPPRPVQWLMRAAAKVMTTTAHYV
ncbi:MAG: 2-polyprenyl-3-methyl-6-methoxy-1,4-benzoquinone monooxygenase [Burkholderiales bacterium]